MTNYLLKHPFGFSDPVIITKEHNKVKEER